MSDGAPKLKRFYKQASAAKTGGGYRIMLDGRAIKSASGAPVEIRSGVVAEAVADEWREQGDEVDRAAMPLTNIVMAGGADAEALQQWRDDIVSYLGTDLLCYRAGAPAALAERQAKHWDPFLAWFGDRFGADLAVAVGIIAIDQPPQLSQALAREIADIDGATLFALRSATAITGSAVLGYCLWRGAFDAEEIFFASRVDELFQREKWGVDEEAVAREAALFDEFAGVARYFGLLRA